MFNTVTDFLGGEVLMYASDYPHSECQFRVGRQCLGLGRASTPRSGKSVFWATRPASSSRSETVVPGWRGLAGVVLYCAGLNRRERAMMSNRSDRNADATSIT